MGELFRGNCLGGESPGDNCSGGNFMWGNCPVGSCPGGDYSGAIVWGVKVRGEVAWGNFMGRNCPEGRELSRGELSLNRFQILKIQTVLTLQDKRNAIKHLHITETIL